MNTPKFNIGDQVAYSVQFLEAIGEAPYGELCHCRGVITGIEQLDRLSIAVITWDNPDAPLKVNTFNLAHVGPNPRFAKC